MPRFSLPDFEFSNLYERIHETNTPHTHHHTHERIPNPSILAWVDVVGAGLLHNEKSPAILAFYETPKLLDVTVSHSAHDGVTLISAHHSFEMLHNRFVPAASSHSLWLGFAARGSTAVFFSVSLPSSRGVPCRSSSLGSSFIQSHPFVGHCSQTLE